MTICLRHPALTELVGPRVRLDPLGAAAQHPRLWELARQELYQLLDHVHRHWGGAPIMALRAACRTGRINGLEYNESCACVIGTLAQAAGRQVFQIAPCGWLMHYPFIQALVLSVRPGHTDQDRPELAAVVAWIDQWLAERSAPPAPPRVRRTYGRPLADYGATASSAAASVASGLLSRLQAYAHPARPPCGSTNEVS